MTNITRLALFDESAATSNIAVIATTASVSLGRVSSEISESLLVTVVGADPVFVGLGDSGVTATLTNRPYLGNSQQVINLPAGVTHAAAISTGTASKVYFTPGNGA